MLTGDQHDEFRVTGLLRLGGAIPPAADEAMCDRLWEFLASQYAIDRGEPSTWTVEQPARFQPVTHSGAFRAVAPNRLTQPRMMLTDMASPDQSDSCRLAGHDQGALRLLRPPPRTRAGREVRCLPQGQDQVPWEQNRGR